MRDLTASGTTPIAKNRTTNIAPRVIGALYTVDPKRCVTVVMNWQKELSVNQLHKPTIQYINGRAVPRLYTNPATEAWMSTLGALVREQVNVRNMLFHTNEEFIVSADIYVPTDIAHPGDKDNFWKVIFDGVKRGLVDDAAFIPLQGYFERVKRHDARIEITVAPILKTELFR